MNDCDYDHPHPDHPCGQAGTPEDFADPGYVRVDDLCHADVKGLFAGIGLSLTTPGTADGDADA